MTTTCLMALLLGVQVTLSDLLSRRVSNQVLLLVLGGVMVMQALRVGGAPSLGQCLLGGGIGLAVLLPVYAIGWMGAGDVKLFSVIGFLLGTQALLPIWIIASLAAGAHALLVVVWTPAASLVPSPVQRLLRTMQGSAFVLDWQMDLRSARRGRRGIPYAAYMGMAMIGITLQGGGYV